ncbi:MAG: T9SS type A sorting domain-containing protein [Chitinophagaceae bacterium]|nr:T9SS type A sorting domain-containing protein [Chitinophagaceae bacterium]
MENLSNNSKRSNSHSPLGLWLFVFCMLPYMAMAQAGFNKLYTNDATASLFQAIVPFGEKGAFITMAISLDSSIGDKGVRISRFDQNGNEEKSNFFTVPEYPDKEIEGNIKAITKINENLYAIVGTLAIPSAQICFILTLDSNLNKVRFKELIKPIVGMDTFMYCSSVVFDDQKHLLIAGQLLMQGDTLKSMLFKLDTALNEIWHKVYQSPSNFITTGIFDLLVDESGYTLFGGTRNYGITYDTNYRHQSIIIKTDTAGNQQWHYASPKAALTDCQGVISEALRTKDGGYLYSTSAMAYNAAIPTAAIDLQSKRVLIKLDAARNKLWQTAIDDYYSRFSGISYIKIIELADSSFKVVTHVTVDSFGKNFKYGRYMQLHYSKDGKLIYRRILRAPKDASDTSSESAGGMYDMIATAEKGFVMCGVYYNRTIGASLPSQRGWIMKVDSNGCIGPSDPQCDPLSIPKQPQIAEVGFSVYPNPANDFINIEGLQSSTELRLYNIVGQEMKRITTQNNKAQIGIAELPSGMYLLHLKTDAGDVYTTKVVKE